MHHWTKTVTFIRSLKIQLKQWIVISPVRNQEQTQLLQAFLLLVQTPTDISHNILLHQSNHVELLTER